MASRRSAESSIEPKMLSWLWRRPPGLRERTTRDSSSLERSFCDSVRVLSASVRMRMTSYVASGRATRDRDNRSSIWMSVALRSWAARMLSSFSGWEDKDGGDSKRVRGRVIVLLDPSVVGVSKSVVDVSTVTAGAMVSRTAFVASNSAAK